MTEYKVIYSLGIRCFTEEYLKKLGLKNFSSIFGSLNMKTIDNIIKCIESDFDLLLNPKYLISVNKIPSLKSLCEKYGNSRTLNTVFDNLQLYNSETFDHQKLYHSATFAHYDFEMPGVKEHFERGVERFNKIKNHKLPTLFLNISDMAESDNTDVNTINKFVQLLLSKGWDNFHIIFIYFNTDCKNQNIKNEYYTIIYINFHPLSDPSEISDKVIKYILNKYTMNLLSIKEIDELSI
jgi:hypothetical protein